MASSSKRRLSSSRLSRGSQRALPSSIWGSQRPRAIRLRAQRCRWVHQRRSSAISGWSPARGSPLSHSAALAGSRAQPSTCQGHHSGSLGMGSPACRGKPLHWPACLVLPLAAWWRLGKLRVARAGLRASDHRLLSSNQVARSSSLRASGCSGASRSGVAGVATRQVSAHKKSLPPEPSGGNSQVACNRLMKPASGPWCGEEAWGQVLQGMQCQSTANERQPERQPKRQPPADQHHHHC